MEELGSSVTAQGDRSALRGAEDGSEGLEQLQACWDVSALGSALPSALHGVCPSPAWESVPAAATGTNWCPAAWHSAGTPIRDKRLLFHQNFSLWEVPRSEHWPRAQPHHGCPGVTVVLVGTSLGCSAEGVSVTLASREGWGCHPQDSDSGFLAWQEGRVPALCCRVHGPLPGAGTPSVHRHWRLS